MTTLLLSILVIILAWTASLFDWMVSYATSFAQLGVWITLLSLVSGWSIWSSLKKQPFTETPKSQLHVNWNVSLKS